MGAADAREMFLRRASFFGGRTELGFISAKLRPAESDQPTANSKIFKFRFCLALLASAPRFIVSRPLLVSLGPFGCRALRGPMLLVGGCPRLVPGWRFPQQEYYALSIPAMQGKSVEKRVQNDDLKSV